ncbi:MAG: CrcB family protein [Actinomycetia bacterium]|nr:CrcB family protein [Actinomycetes bacterium]
MDDRFRIAVAVGLGGAVGTTTRAVIASLLSRWGAAGLWGVLFVNIVGALALGWYAARVRHTPRWSATVAGFVAVGLLGSFTTFSAFSLEVVDLFADGSWLSGTAYAMGSVGAGLTAALVGRSMAARS